MSSEEGNCGGRKEKPGRKEHIHWNERNVKREIQISTLKAKRQEKVLNKKVDIFYREYKKERKNGEERKMNSLRKIYTPSTDTRIYTQKSRVAERGKLKQAIKAKKNVKRTKNYIFLKGCLYD